VHGFHDGHPEALIEGGEDEGEAGIEQGGEIVVGEETREEDGAAEAEGVDDGEKALGAIAWGTGEDEAEESGGVAAAEESEGGEEEFVILVEPEVGGIEEEGGGMEVQAIEDGVAGGGADEGQAPMCGVADDKGFRGRWTGGGLDAVLDIETWADEEAGDGACLAEMAMADEAVVFGEELRVGEELEVVDEADGGDGGVMVSGSGEGAEEEVGAEGAEEVFAIEGEKGGFVGEAEALAESAGHPGGEAGLPLAAAGDEAASEGGGTGFVATTEAEAGDVGGFAGGEFVMAGGAGEEDELGLRVEGSEGAEEFESERFGATVFAAGAEGGEIDGDAGEREGGRDGGSGCQLSYLGEC
jgi:hypothetical protein